ncbi:MAG: PAS domain S-box protein [Rhizobiales bacterium]|nr:PAS domain S-box protein [Hyphomicrobiales bacterium]
MSRIRGHLGYGGIIHNFKNYVLRKDPRYFASLQTQLKDFTATLREYRESGASDVELVQLAAIETAVESYRSKLVIAEQAAREGWAPQRTDVLVKVDDSAALEALSSLDRYWREKRRETTRAIANAVRDGQELVAVGFNFLGGLAVVALALYALFYLLQKELRQTIGLLSNELKERKLAEHVAKKFHRAVDQSPATITITDTQGIIEYVNPKFTSLTGYQPEEVIGRTPRLLQSGDEPPELYANLRRQLALGQEWHGTFRNLKKDGSAYWSKTNILPLRDEDGSITHFIGLGEDITERRKVREHIHRAQKMEAVGLLASGVAHDFNNVLTTILGNVHLAKLDAPEHETLAEELDQIEIAAKRARNLVNQVLAFARRQPGAMEPVGVADILQEVTRLMRASILPNIEISCVVDDEDLAVIADPTRLHQVIMNLCSNAAEAIGSEGGKITLSATASAGTEAGDDKSLVHITICDSGPGVPEDLRTQIFDPFFTTKATGKGTGLGLSVVANLVAEMNGQVRLNSPEAGGAGFEVLLPRSERRPKPATKPESLGKGVGRILLIDDEAEVLRTCAKILERQGYVVDMFINPEKALETFNAEAQDFALVMTDFVMPELNGQQVCNTVRKSRPDCPIIVYSAYQPATLDLKALQPIRLLDKPVDPGHLSRTVAELLSPPAVK